MDTTMNVNVSTFAANGNNCSIATSSHKTDDRVTAFVSTYVTAACVLIGCLGNVISVTLLLCTKLKYQSSTHYVIGVIVANTFCLLTAALKWAATFQVELYLRAGWCQFAWFIENTCVFLSVWCTVGFAVDRYVGIRWPNKASACCNTFRAKSAIVALALVGTVVYMNISLVVGVGLHNNDNNNNNGSKHNNNNNNNNNIHQPQCTILPDYFSNMKFLRSLDIALNFVVPYAAVLIILGCVCRCLSNETTRDDDGIFDDSQLHRWTCAFLGLFLVLRLPREIIRTTSFSTHYYYNFVELDNHSAKSPPAEHYAKIFSNQLYLASLSLHFLLLVLVHKGFAYFCYKTLTQPEMCCSKQRRHLVAQDDDHDSMALDNIVVTGRV